MDVCGSYSRIQNEFYDTEARMLDNRVLIFVVSDRYVSDG